MRGKQRDRSEMRLFTVREAFLVKDGRIIYRANGLYWSGMALHYSPAWLAATRPRLQARRSSARRFRGCALGDADKILRALEHADAARSALGIRTRPQNRQAKLKSAIEPISSHRPETHREEPCSSKLGPVKLSQPVFPKAAVCFRPRFWRFDREATS